MNHETASSAAIPKIDDVGDVPIDVETLILSKLLASANSGGGKSRLLRRIAEQTWGYAQQLIFDAEGDFHTLREKFPYLLFGPGGDAPLTVEIAAKLILRLLEVGSSAILDLSELPVLDAKEGGDQRAVFIQKALHAAMQAPRELWHPSIWIIDEIHLWAPENGFGTAVSTATVCDFFTRGRKRGWGGIAATQRLAAVHKSVAAECNNRLIGRTGLDVDQTRAAKNLGMKATAETFRTLANLEPGEFFAFGPALSKQVVRVRSGAVITTHPTAGHRATAPTPAPAKVKQMLAQFRDLPKEVAKEVDELEALRARVRTLEADKSGLECDLENRKTNQQHLDELHAKDMRIAELEQSLSGALERKDREIAAVERQVQLYEDVFEDMVAEFRLISDRATNASNLFVDRMQDIVEREPTAKPAPTISDDMILAARVQARAGASVGTTIVATMPTSAERASAPTQYATENATPPGEHPDYQTKLLRTIYTISALNIAVSASSLAAWIGTDRRNKTMASNLAALREAGYLQDFALTDQAWPVVKSASITLDALRATLDEYSLNLVDLLARMQKLGIERTATSVAAWLGTDRRNKTLASTLEDLRTRGLVEGCSLTIAGGRFVPSHLDVMPWFHANLPSFHAEILALAKKTGTIDSASSLASMLGTDRRNKTMNATVENLRYRGVLTLNYPLELTDAGKALA